jgi:hypothetical protein
MCRSQADGGRRCPNSSRASAGHAGDMSPRPKWSYCDCAGSHKPGCPNAGVPEALPPLADDDQRESYEGTPWQGYDEYMQRSAELDRRIAAGESITDIMQEEKRARLDEQVAQIKREAEQARAEEARGW